MLSVGASENIASVVTSFFFGGEKQQVRLLAVLPDAHPIDINLGQLNLGTDVALFNLLP